MNQISFWCLSLLLTVVIAAEETPITRIAFGSCANQSAPQVNQSYNPYLALDSVF